MENEIWKDIEGYEGIYQVSNLGRVKSLPKLYKRKFKSYYTKEKILKNSLGKNGYYRVNLSQKIFYIHRLVAEAFIPNSDEKKTVNHIDGVKTNNNISNLEWATYAENNKHAYDTGLKKIYTKDEHWKTKLNKGQVKELKLLVKLGYPKRKVGNLFNISHTTVTRYYEMY